MWHYLVTKMKEVDKNNANICNLRHSGVTNIATSQAAGESREAFCYRNFRYYGFQWYTLQEPHHGKQRKEQVLFQWVSSTC